MQVKEQWELTPENWDAEWEPYIVEHVISTSILRLCSDMQQGHQPE